MIKGCPKCVNRGVHFNTNLRVCFIRGYNLSTATQVMTYQPHITTDVCIKTDTLASDSRCLDHVPCPNIVNHWQGQPPRGLHLSSGCWAQFTTSCHCHSRGSRCIFSNYTCIHNISSMWCISSPLSNRYTLRYFNRSVKITLHTLGYFLRVARSSCLNH